ncbi:MAG TPA: hypothetical protein VNO81_11680, partial [Candidatus Nitrosotenuis sp.]|nr:hypothetical protein [Candidatus Nitrosotenuis sp.]
MARGGNGSPLAPPQSPARPARLGGEEPAPRGLAPAARALLACLVTVTLALILVIWCEHLAGAELNFPLGYGADADTTYSLAYIQGLLETGSYWHHPRLGMPAPQGISTYQFPQPEALARLMLLALGAFWPSPAVLANLFYLASYPLVAGAALFALRRLGLGWLLAGAFALLYAFLPWHFYREQHHLFYSSYYLVPLMALVALQVAQGRPLVLDQDGRWRPGGRESLEALVLCVLNGLSTVYYAAFAIFFLLVAGLAAWLEERRPAHLARALLLGAVVAAAALAQHAPALAYRASHPGAGPAFSRLPQESEEYGLKIAQLLLPVPGHRLGPWSDLRAYYDRHFPLVNENSSATLGALGSLGFLILLGWLFFRRPRPGDPVLEDLLTRLSILNGAGLLLGTVGGFSSLAGLGFTPLLRSVNRVSIYLAFFSLAA